jgi:hypothetical protein
MIYKFIKNWGKIQGFYFWHCISVRNSKQIFLKIIISLNQGIFDELMTRKEDFENHGFSKMSLWYCSVVCFILFSSPMA